MDITELVCDEQHISREILMMFHVHCTHSHWVSAHPIYSLSVSVILEAFIHRAVSSVCYILPASDVVGHVWIPYFEDVLWYREADVLDYWLDIYFPESYVTRVECASSCLFSCLCFVVTQNLQSLRSKHHPTGSDRLEAEHMSCEVYHPLETGTNLPQPVVASKTSDHFLPSSCIGAGEKSEAESGIYFQ